MAGALEIPAVVGLGRFVIDVSGGDQVIVDGNRGVLILNPDEETLERYERTRSSFRTFETQLGELRDLPAEIENLLYDPQTSGGLLIAASRDAAEQVGRALASASVHASVVGTVEPADDRFHVVVRA